MNDQAELNPGHEFSDDDAVMQHALQIARRGIGFVEPNPPVGAVIVDEDRRLIASGIHERCGEAHAEINAVAAATGRTSGQQIFVTLEPCSHHGKTPPCADALIRAGFQRVVVGCTDPAPHVAGSGIARLREFGVQVDVGVCAHDAEHLIAPFRKLQTERRPWVHAKWAMTLDGRIAAHTRHSKWISNEQSRAVVHQLRGHMDAIVTGAGTVRADDPLLTVRPPGCRVPIRVVVDSDGRSVTPESRLVQSIDQAPLLVCVRAETADMAHCEALQGCGAEVMAVSGSPAAQIEQLADELGRRDATHVLLEAGPGLLGTFFDGGLVDEVHVFIAAKIVGGQAAFSPIGGAGLSGIPEADSLTSVRTRLFGTNVLMEGRIRRSADGG